MPTYDYECAACGHTFEKFQSMSAAPVRVCPVCGKSEVRRLIGAGAGIIFKGTGFYQTDYKKAACPAGRGEGRKCGEARECGCGEARKCGCGAGD